MVNKIRQNITQAIPITITTRYTNSKVNTVTNFGLPTSNQHTPTDATQAMHFGRQVQEQYLSIDTIRNNPLGLSQPSVISTVELGESPD